MIKKNEDTKTFQSHFKLFKLWLKEYFFFQKEFTELWQVFSNNYRK
jgi:hypothetical protein